MSESVLLDQPLHYVSTNNPFYALVSLFGAIVRAGRENSVVLREKAEVERKFQEYVNAWKAESMFMSSITDMVQLPSYQAIIQLGRRAVPLLLNELQRDHDHWFVALSAITGEDPVPPEDRGDLDKMTEAWLRWGRYPRPCR